MPNDCPRLGKLLLLCLPYDRLKFCKGLGASKIFANDSRFTSLLVKFEAVRSVKWISDSLGIIA